MEREKSGRQSSPRRIDEAFGRLLEVALVLFERIDDQEVAFLVVLIALAGAGALYQTVAGRRLIRRFALPDC